MPVFYLLIISELFENHSRRHRKTAPPTTSTRERRTRMRQGKGERGKGKGKRYKGYSVSRRIDALDTTLACLRGRE